MTAVLSGYRVQHSARAKHVRLKVTPADGVVVVVPKGFDERLLPALVKEQSTWIEKQLDRLGDALAIAGRVERPTRIDLNACGEQWHIHYEATASAQIRVTETEGATLHVRGAIDDDARAHNALRRWLARRARETLTHRLDALSARYGLPYTRATIRFQRSRWGSCSSRGTISLNAQLMFLPANLVRCVLAHELCHTTHLNHGPRFWTLLETLEPGHRALHRELRHGWNHIPTWIHA